MSETVSTFFESGLLLKPLKKSLVALQEVIVEKKKTFICYLQDKDCQHPYFSILVLVQSREWNLGPTTLQSSTLPLNQSSRGLTCIEPKFNSATKAGIIT